MFGIAAYKVSARHAVQETYIVDTPTQGQSKSEKLRSHHVILFVCFEPSWGAWRTPKSHLRKPLALARVEGMSN